MDIPDESLLRGRARRVAPVLRWRVVRNQENKKEHAMLIALPMALVAVVLLKTLELAANHG